MTKPPDRPRNEDAVPSPTPPWRRKKRCVAALALWLILAYPVSFWPDLYANARGWVPAAAAPVLDFVYWPLLSLSNRNGPLADALTRAAIWVHDLGERHAASD